MKGSIDEVVARALFEANPTRNKALQWEHAAVPKGRYRKQATATLAALSEAGYVIVPREPTEKMVGDGAGAAAFADGFIAPSIIAEPERVLQKALDAGLTGAVVPCISPWRTYGGSVV